MPPRAFPRYRLLLVPIAAAATAFPVLASGAVAHASSSVHYVALGDSYSSGLGAGDEGDGSCDQSPNAYSALWAAQNAPASYVTEACAGATTSDVISGQLSALSGSTSLVSITIGGNDVGFSSVMETCVLDSTSSCVSAIDQAESEMHSTLPGALDTTFADINADAPSANVVVLDYPDLYDLSQSSGCIGLSTTDRTDLNQAADELDSVEQTAAQNEGDTFADIRSAFSGHQICDSDSWLHSVNFLDIDESYHPTATGQADGYLPVFSDAAG
ncbi:MAG TPA: SGNH/GDSL hydrolase family protein [Streptosporangiaceae bacterium]|nr:SGNH/GDSL hydrolase family protein [Streptosporangiaceae bacterium]